MRRSALLPLAVLPLTALAAPAAVSAQHALAGAGPTTRRSRRPRRYRGLLPLFANAVFPGGTF